MRRGVLLTLSLLAALSLAWLAAESAWAASYGIDTTLDYVQNITKAGNGMMETVLRYARSLFIGLATLSLGLGLIRMLLNGEANLGTVAAHVAKWILYTGIFSWLMSNNVPQTIVNSFVAIGSKVGGQSSIAPDNILAAGIRMYGSLVQKGWEAGWGDFIGVTLLGVIILAVIAMIAGTFALALVEMHLVICGGAVLLGFGGFEYTRDIALSYLKYVISVGIKLVIVMVIYGLANSTIPNWESSFSSATDMTTLITAAGQILGGVICIYMVVRYVPNMAQAVVNRAALSLGHPSTAVVYTSSLGNAPITLQSNGGLASALMDALRGTRQGGTAGAGESGAAPASSAPSSEDYAVREYVRGQDGMLSGAGYNPIAAHGAPHPTPDAPWGAEAMTNYVAPHGGFPADPHGGFPADPRGGFPTDPRGGFPAPPRGGFPAETGQRAGAGLVSAAGQMISAGAGGLTPPAQVWPGQARPAQPQPVTRPTPPAQPQPGIQSTPRPGRERQ